MLLKRLKFDKSSINTSHALRDLRNGRDCRKAMTERTTARMLPCSTMQSLGTRELLGPSSKAVTRALCSVALTDGSLASGWSPFKPLQKIIVLGREWPECRGVDTSSE